MHVVLSSACVVPISQLALALGSRARTSPTHNEEGTSAADAASAAQDAGGSATQAMAASVDGGNDGERAGDSNG
eukprot:628628-Pleurochrysis_carterae.AAC.1